MLVWPNGAEARLYSAFDPERLRGPQFDAVWADELAKWPKAQETWDMMQFGLRLGLRPYSVSHLKAAPSGSSLAVSWIRRARIGGDNWDGEDVPLSESFERYAVRVFRDGILAREVRVTSPEFSYTAAMQAADGVGTLRFDVAQVSEVYGEGPSKGLTVDV